MRVLLVGAGGMLATDLEEALRSRGDFEVISRSEESLDITDRRALPGAVCDARPGCILNCAAYTDVDGAESNEGLAFAVNADGAANLADAAKSVGALLVHISTDFIFDGRKKGAYLEDDPPNPLSVYGKSKLEGEERVRASGCRYIIVRTAWLYWKGGGNFVKKIRELALERGRIKVVTDQRGSPTWTVDLSGAIISLLDAGAEGTFNAAGAGSCSRFEFAREIVRLSGLPAVVEPTVSSEYPSPARRPANSVLNCDKLFRVTGYRFRRWETALADFIRFLDGEER